MTFIDFLCDDKDQIDRDDDDETSVTITIIYEKNDNFVDYDVIEDYNFTITVLFAV